MRAANAQLLGSADDSQTPVARLTVLSNEYCAPALALELSGSTGDAGMGRAAQQLDSVVALGSSSGASQRVTFDRFLPLIAARWAERVGNLAAARRHLERRATLDYRSGALTYLSTYLVEEGRVAAQLGDRSAAIRAYQHYLALRSDPEPSLRPAVERVRAELARLIAEPPTN